MRQALKVALVICVPILGSCSDVSTDAPRSLSLEFTSSATSANPGQAIDFSFSATGALLIGVTLDYDDGTEERVEGLGAQTMGATRAHAWEVVGTYEVLATLEDGSLGRMTRSITIEVTTP